MDLITRYIAKTIVQAIAMVALILSCIEVFVLFVNELHDIGEGYYGVGEAFIFSLLQLPMLSYQFFPLASLLGSLLGLGILSSNSELTVMRSAGVSIRRIAVAVLLAALFLLSLFSTLGELVAPNLEHYAHQRKALATSGGQALQTAHGMWLRQGKSFIHIDQLDSKGTLRGIRSYQFDDQQRLVKTLYAKQANYHDKQWQLHDVAVSELKPQRVNSQHFSHYHWDLSLSPSLLRVAAIEPDQMSLRYLYRYIRAHHGNYGEVSHYKLAFWSRILQPLTTCVMMLLSIPFIFGSQRTMTMGARMVWGLTVGFGFYMLNQFFGPVSLVLLMPPLLAASLPTLLFAFSALWMMRRVR